MPKGRAPASHLDRRAPRAASFFTRAESKTGIEPGFNLQSPWIRFSTGTSHQSSCEDYSLSEIDDLETFLANDDEFVTEEMHVESLGWHEEVLDEGERKLRCTRHSACRRLTLYTRNQSFLALRKCVNARRFRFSSISRPVIGSRQRKTLLICMRGKVG